MFSHFDFGRSDFSFSEIGSVDEEDVGLTASAVGGRDESAGSRSEPRESREALSVVTVRSSHGRIDRWFPLW